MLMENVYGWIHNPKRFMDSFINLSLNKSHKRIENPMTSDEILSSILGVRSRYVRGKGHGNKPPKKSQMQQENIEASVSSAVESMRQEMQLDMERRLQEKGE
ncbi:hypothetical protein P3L10_005503 [Capsicum annuum]